MPTQRVDVSSLKFVPEAPGPASLTGRVLGRELRFALVGTPLLIQLAKGARLTADLSDDGELSNFEVVA